MTSRHRRALIGRRIHESILDLIAVLNLPQRDETLIAETGVDLDRALLQVLVAIRRFGPIGVVELAERGGRDHTTVSRQVAKLAELGLVERRPSAIDRRVKEAVLTEAGRRVTEALDAARERMFLPALTEWSDRDLLELDRLLRRLADDLTTAATLAERKED
ncbi:MarR family winged helix-turn-helix transcriptional regulator [Thermopolyspora flexuosa]|nr:MarR family transcriptional regulator [Thermopolyspora flexuosa]